MRAALLEDVPRVLEHFGITFRNRGAELLTVLCPACGQRSRPSVCISAETGVWIDHARGCHGDIFALVAGYSGLDVQQEFPRVLELAGGIVGLSVVEVDSERDQRIAERRRAADDQQRRREGERAVLRATMPLRWATLDQRHPGGERYLRDRGLDPDVLRHSGDLVRYTPNGDPTLALRDISTGAIVGIQSRRLGGERKIHTVSGSQVAGAVLAGRLVDLDPGGVDVAALVEGLADTLAAHLQWPGCAIFGAPGAGQLPTIAAALARRILVVRGWLLLTVDNDDAGVTQAGRAIVAAVGAGLALAPPTAQLDRPCTVRLVELGRHHDLADAHAAGWRFEWPTSRPA